MLTDTITVTQDHIEQARESRESGQYDVLKMCPMALAAQETITRLGIPGEVSWAYNNGTVAVPDPDDEGFYPSTHHLLATDRFGAADWVRNFDASFRDERREVQPVTFEVQILGAKEYDADLV